MHYSFALVNNLGCVEAFFMTALVLFSKNRTPDS